MSLWSHVIDVNPQIAIAYNNRGTARSDKRLALSDYSKTIELDPEFPEAYFNRGKAYFHFGKYALAIPDFTKCIELDPKDAEALYWRSLSYRHLGLIKESELDEKTARAMGFNP